MGSAEDAVVAAARRWVARIADGSPPNMWADDEDLGLIAAVEALPSGSGVCYCGSSMEDHPVWDNHAAIEMPLPTEGEARCP